MYANFLPQFFPSASCLPSPLISCFYSVTLHSIFVRYPAFPPVFLCRFHLWETIWPLRFWDWLISLGMKFSTSIHLLANDKISFFLWLNRTPLCLYTTFSLSFLLLVGTQAGSITCLLCIVLIYTLLCVYHFSMLILNLCHNYQGVG